MSDSRWERWGPLGGIGFAVLFVVGMALNNLPQGDDSIAKIASFYNDSGDRATLIISSYLLVLAGMFFLWFLASLRVRLLAVEGAPGRLTAIAFGSGLVFVALLMAAACCFLSVAGDVSFGGEKFASAEAARYLPELGYPLLLIGGAFAAIAMVDAASLLIVRTGMLPSWVGYFGFFTAIALLFGFLFLPFVTLLLWVVFVSVTMMQVRPAAPATAPQPPV
jgi:hypothetical protein